MRHITKQAPPRELIAWTRTKAEAKDSRLLAWGYADMPADIRRIVKESLLHEQGGLCCYTGRRITSESSHIEHIKPQNQCLNHEDTEYSNLLAAYPAWNAPKECKYGAHAKKGWFDEYLFVHPLRPDCEARIRYNLNGKITPVNSSDQGTDETIRRLRLDHPELINMRKEAIYVALFEKELTKSQVQRLMNAIEQRNSQGLFRPFCFVIKQACQKYLKRFDSVK